MKKDLISVIVPIYNVEVYLRKCIDSILAQDYPNLEIILVDDGATDNCGQICDEYAQKHSNITVIHKKNGGLSSARNAGIEIAKGKYISFVDSDDWIESDMISTLYNDLKQDNADISAIVCYQEYSDGRLIKNSHQTEKSLLSREEALSCFLFNDYLTPCAWGKLYNIELWKDIRFPEGKLFEDQLTIYKILDLADNVVFNPLPKYYYFKREGSIGHSAFNDRTYDLYHAINEEYQFLVNKYPNIKADLVVGKITWEIVFINMMLRGGKNDQELIKKVRKYARENYLSVIKCPYINKVRKLQILLFSFCFSTYKKLYFQYKNRNGIS